MKLVRLPIFFILVLFLDFADGAVDRKSYPSDRCIETSLRKHLVINSKGELPIVLDRSVLDELDHLVCSKKGRAFLMSGMSQMPNYDRFVKEKLEEFHLPEELNAIPLVESGYRNLSAEESRGAHLLSPGAGLWMFVSKTARRFGLDVDLSLGVDERLHVRRQTEAAMRLLRFLHGHFKDWGLALAAYNQGEGHVQRAIDETGVRDAWALARQGKINRYLSRVIATVLVLKNPQLLKPGAADGANYPQ